MIRRQFRPTRKPCRCKTSGKPIAKAKQRNVVSLLSFRRLDPKVRTARQSIAAMFAPVGRAASLARD